MPLLTRNQKAKEDKMEPETVPEGEHEMSTEEKIDKLLKNTEGTLNLKIELDKLTKSVQTLTADIATLKRNTDSIPKIEASITGIQSTITTLNVDTAANIIATKENQDRITTLEQENVSLKTELENLKCQTRRNINVNNSTIEDLVDTQIKRQQDKSSLLFEGVTENKNESLKQLIKQISFDAGLTISDNDIDEVYRLGKFNPHEKRPRTIKVTFTTKGTRMVFWNVRSILNKMDSIRLKLQNEHISVLIITESWLKPDIPTTLINIEGYMVHRFDRNYMNEQGYLKRGGGIIVYIKDTLSFDNINGDMFNVSNCNIEFTTLCIKRPHTRRMYLLAVYRPPTGKVKDCITILENGLNFLPHIEKSDVFIGGDFNIDYVRSRQENTKKLKHFATQHQLTQYIKESTRPLQSDAVIDLIFSNCTNIQYSGTLPWNLSDHIPVIVNIKKKKAILEKAEFKGRSYRNFDKNIFLNSLNNRNWINFENTLDVDIKWENLYNNVLETLDAQIPVKTFIFPKSKPEWLVADLVEYMKDRDSLLKKASRTKDPKDKKAANKARNRTNRLVKSAKNNFIKDKLNEYINNPKKFWEQIKSTYPSDKNQNQIRFTDHEGNTLNNSDTAILINNYFTNIGPDLAKITKDMARNMDLENLNPNTVIIQPNPNCPTLDLHHPPIEQLIKKINEIKTFKSSGLPLVASRIWKIVFQDNPYRLFSIITRSIVTNTFPKKWKYGTVIPIPKISKPKGPEDLRPISLLPLPGKIFEHLIHSQIDCFLEQNNLITKKQNGFRAKHSTIQTVFDFTSDLLNFYNDQLDTIAIYIDFKKAFDTVNHSLLIKKLTKFNFGKDTCQLLESYLSERHQSTFINGHTSDERLISYGVPQGSVLGPKLFLMYINDLVYNIHHCKSFLYADDIVMYQKIGKTTSLRDIDLFKQDIKSIEIWCLKNELTVNIKKTKLQYFPHNRNTDHIAFENEVNCLIYGQDLSYVNTFKYLGIDIDRNLNMKSFYDSMYKHVNHKLYLLKLIRPSLTIDAALAVGKSMILSLIDYGNIFLTGVTQQDKSDLQKLQNKILRCCLNIVDPLDINTLEMHDLVKVESVGKRRVYNLLTIIHKGVKNNKFNMLNHNVNTRHNDGHKIDLIRPRNEHVRNSSFYMGTSYWNELSLEIRELDTKSFKNRIKKKIQNGEIPVFC